MNSNDLWNRLPSAAELLENPRVRRLVDRLNPTVVTAQVRGFLEEVRSEIAERAHDAGVPSLTELADRVGGYLRKNTKQGDTSAVNATGLLRGGNWSVTPLAEAALEHLLLTGQDYAQTAESADAPTCEAVHQLQQLTGAPAAVVLHSHAAALRLVMQTLPAPRQMVIARGELTTLESGQRLTDLAAVTGVTLHEVGAADGVSEQDYQAALTSDTTLLRLAMDQHAGTPLCRPALETLLPLARQHSSQSIIDLDAAPLLDLNFAAETLSCSARQAIQLGADVVLLRGDGLLGGPPCGIVLGQAAAVERLTADPWTAAMRLDPLRSAALAATLRLYDKEENPQYVIPTLSLLSTPAENLRTRAERLAPQLAECELVQEATVVELPAQLPTNVPWQGPSWGVRVTAQPEALCALQQRLSQAVPAVQGMVQEDAIILNLRTVFPRQDFALLGAFGLQGSPADESAMQPANCETSPQ